MTTTRTPSWIPTTLLLAAIYNLAWGASVVVAPGLFFALLGLEPPRYPQIWQCVGMIVGVYGMGYGIAATNPARHWPIVLVGLLGKIFGPLGFAFAALQGTLPWIFGLTIISNDLIWVVPFGLILAYAWRVNRDATVGEEIPTVADALKLTRDQDGESLAAVSHDGPLLVVFLRHLGCTFCREALGDLARDRRRLEEAGVSLAVVHMASDSAAAELLRRYGLDDISRFADPQRRLYRAFSLRRGRLGQLFGPSVWLRGMAATLRGHVVGKLAGDALQMPGAFLIHSGRIVRAYRHKTAADRPDYEALACGTGAGATSGACRSAPAHAEVQPT